MRRTHNGRNGMRLHVGILDRIMNAAYVIHCTSFLTREGTTSCKLSNAVRTSHIDSMSAMISTPVKILLAFEGAISMLTYGSLLGSSSISKLDVIRSLADKSKALVPIIASLVLSLGDIDPLFSPDPEFISRITWSLVKEWRRCPPRNAIISNSRKAVKLIIIMVGQAHKSVR